jgi:hypothetical protein
MGGYGGNGCNGGRGGNAGNGGNGGNITIHYHSATNINRVVPLSIAGSAGNPGDPGNGGAGGTGGQNEIFPAKSPATYAPTGQPGLQTGGGNAGNNGNIGTVIMTQV